MKEEFTTKMHSELLGDEISNLDLRIMGIYGATGRGVSLNEALKKYDVSREIYDKNIDRVLSE
ncbi:hypothetical protein G7050_02745 [Dysgonomonas sp. HDW5A]|uniref:hypothetical protein n=1 Tax=Dysgonomonas sp. HDW5A TaxID=2714926 RepID=UPI00140847D5|nr:hypothetical protein [Dysgonomonas sp. HDW5A]QIK58818.1 hypothetical protein G7050_02745 [Dysgonomonas sp. HDW5A]